MPRSLRKRLRSGLFIVFCLCPILPRKGGRAGAMPGAGAYYNTTFVVEVRPVAGLARVTT